MCPGVHQTSISRHVVNINLRCWGVEEALFVAVWHRYPLAVLMGSLEELYPRHAMARPRAGRHVLFEYVMLRGVNDSLDDAARLVSLTADIECKVNLILFNPHAGTPFKASTHEQVRVQAGSPLFGSA